MRRVSQWMGFWCGLPLSHPGRRTPLSPRRRRSPAMGKHAQAFKLTPLALSTLWPVSITLRAKLPLRLTAALPPLAVARELCPPVLTSVLGYEALLHWRPSAVIVCLLDPLLQAFT